MRRPCSTPTVSQHCQCGHCDAAGQGGAVGEPTAVAAPALSGDATAKLVEEAVERQSVPCLRGSRRWMRVCGSRTSCRGSSSSSGWPAWHCGHAGARGDATGGFALAHRYKPARLGASDASGCAAPAGDRRAGVLLCYLVFRQPLPWKRLLHLESFLVLLFLTLPFTVSGEPLLQIGS